MNLYTKKYFIIAVFTGASLLISLQFNECWPVAEFDVIDDMYRTSAFHNSTYRNIKDIESQIDEDDSDIHINCVSKDEYHKIVKKMKFLNYLYLMAVGLCVATVTYMNMSLIYSNCE